jgi:hypothetical protein
MASLIKIIFLKIRVILFTIFNIKIKLWCSAFTNPTALDHEADDVLMKQRSG